MFTKGDKVVKLGDHENVFIVALESNDDVRFSVKIIDLKHATNSI